jgi:hypothetical protein
MAFRDEIKAKKRDEFKHVAVFPCKVKILPQVIPYYLLTIGSTTISQVPLPHNPTLLLVAKDIVACRVKIGHHWTK